MNKPKARHQFGGCNRLLSHYKTIGSLLLNLEQFSYRGFTHDFPEFREGVAFISVETLEAYLEDLLDLEVCEENLFIFREERLVRSSLIALGGMLFALCIGLYAASSGASLFLAFGLTVCLALPFAVLWHFAPREGVMRRLGFAQTVSHEISRRRGHDRDNSDATTSGMVINRFLSRKGTAAQGAALKMFH